jgi:hypothetical protein
MCRLHNLDGLPVHLGDCRTQNLVTANDVIDGTMKRFYIQEAIDSVNLGLCLSRNCPAPAPGLKKPITRLNGQAQSRLKIWQCHDSDNKFPDR